MLLTKPVPKQEARTRPACQGARPSITRSPLAALLLLYFCFTSALLKTGLSRCASFHHSEPSCCFPSALLLLYFWFTSALLLLYLGALLLLYFCFTSMFYVCFTSMLYFTSALLMLYLCFTYALLMKVGSYDHWELWYLLYFCFTYALLMLYLWRWGRTITGSPASGTSTSMKKWCVWTSVCVCVCVCAALAHKPPAASREKLIQGRAVERSWSEQREAEVCVCVCVWVEKLKRVERSWSEQREADERYKEEQPSCV
jgi:hypothetical protein